MGVGVGEARSEPTFDRRVSGPSRWVVDRFVGLVGQHPYAVLVLKSTLAAGLAWLVVQPFGVAADYPYYAPLGAVVVMSTAVMTSVRTGLQAVSALAVGATLAVAIAQVPAPGVVAIMVVVGVGTALSLWPRLGAMGIWVPFAGLFVLMLGGEDPWYYLLGYAGLTAVGAAVGIGVNFAMPQIPLGRALQALIALQEELVRQLRAIAEDIRTEEDLGTDSGRIRLSVRAPAALTEQLVAEVREGRRVNWRAGRWRRTADRRQDQARALETIAYLVEELGTLLGRSSRLRLQGETRVGVALAAALEATADMLDRTDLAAEADEAPSEEARRTVDRLRRLVVESRGQLDNPDEVLVGASASVTLQRAIEAWE